jgi:hypothetical protein
MMKSHNYLYGRVFSAAILISIIPIYKAYAAPSHIKGYQCMALNLSPQQMMDPSVRVPIRSRPLPNAPVTGNAIATVIASSPEISKDGFVKVLQLNGKTGWINARFLKQWVNPGGNGQKCYPSILSDGRIGFDYR